MKLPNLFDLPTCARSVKHFLFTFFPKNPIEKFAFGLPGHDGDHKPFSLVSD